MNDQYRLHIDIPLGDELETAQDLAMFINEILIEGCMNLAKENEKATPILTRLSYRLGNDADRQKSNYMILNPNGHVANKKCHVSLDSGQEWI